MPDRLSPRGLAPTFVLGLVAVSAALNIVFGSLQVALSLPVYLDMVGTCVTAIVLGPWWAALVGVLTNTGAGILRGSTEFPFALANAAGGLLWGYGIWRFHLGRGTLRYFGLTLVVGVVVSVIAGFIAYYVYGGGTGHPGDIITVVLSQAGTALLEATVITSLITGVADKVIAGYVALAIVAALPPDLTAGVDLPPQPRMQRVAVAAGGIVVGLAIVVAYLLLNPPAPA